MIPAVPAWLKQRAAPLALAWLIPIGTHLLHADIVLLPLIVISTASLLRFGATALDRLILASAIIAGLLIGGGLIFSIWPWGLHPVPISGLFLTGLVLTAWRFGRRPRLPRRFRGSDLMILAVGGYAAIVALGPTLRGSYFQGLGYTTLTGDRTRHFNLFDTIHRVGGYTFLNYDAAKPMIDPNMGRTYPSGMHFLYALVDTFVTSRTSPGNTVAELHRYQLYVAGGFAFLVMATAWAAAWVLGAATADWRRTLAAGAVGTWLATGMMTTMLWCTWDPEALGLGFIAILAAVAARPAGRIGTQLLALSSLIVAVGFSYTPFLPFGYAILLAFAVIYRKRLLRHWRLTLAAAAIAIPLSMVESFISTSAGTTGGDTLLMIGFTVPIPRRTLVVIVTLCAAGLLGATQRRRPTGRALAIMISVSALGCAAIAGYQLRHIHQTTYYFEKTLQAFVIVALIGASTVLGLFRGRGQQRTATAPALRGAPSFAAAALVGVLFARGVGDGPVRFDYSKMLPGSDTTWAQVWQNGKQIYPTHGAALGFLGSRHMLGDGKPTLVIWDDLGTENLALSLIAATLNHDPGTLSSQVYGLSATDGLVSVKAAPDGRFDAKGEKGLASLESLIATSPVPLRVVVSNQGVATRLQQFATAHPGLGLKTVYLPDLPPQRSPA